MYILCLSSKTRTLNMHRDEQSGNRSEQSQQRLQAQENRWCLRRLQNMSKNKESRCLQGSAGRTFLRTRLHVALKALPPDTKEKRGGSGT